MNILTEWIHACNLLSLRPRSEVDWRSEWTLLLEKIKNGAEVPLDPRIVAFASRERHFVIPIGSQWYPRGLYRLKYPPLLLFAVGNGKILLQPLLGVVGTRRATPMGKERTSLWAAYWSKHKSWSVVSGLATGIDQAAHVGAMPLTLAVLAFGHDHHYPPENRWLRKKIESEGGLTLSPFAPWVSGRKFRFLERNEVLAALCQSVVVTEAPLKSGAIHTANRALELGCDVHAVPGNPEQIHYRGNNFLIQQGAWPLNDPREICLPGFAQGLECGMMTTQRGESFTDEQKKFSDCGVTS